MKVALFGGTGFVGSYMVRELIRKEFIPRLLVRKGSESKRTSSCEVVYGDIQDENTVIDTIGGTDAVIFNIGIIRQFPKKGISYEKLHSDGARCCIKAACKLGVNRFILMSANGVKSDGTGYQKTKWQADEYLQKSGLNWTIFRPSLIFGDPGGQGRSEFCTQLRDEMLSIPLPAPLFYDGIFPLNAGLFSMSPIHVTNVAEYFVKSITMEKSIGQIYNLGGPETVHWKKVIDCIAMASGKRKWTMPVPVVAIKMVAHLFDRFEWFPITQDQLTMLMQGNKVTEQYFTEFDITPKAFSEENLGYLNT